MAGEPTITVVGNATGDAELKALPSGAMLCSWTLASTPRVKKGDAWEDGEATFYRCTAWRQLAESAAETITRGMRLVVHGKLKTRSYETAAGEKRLSVELDVEDVGPSLMWATAVVTKASRNGGGGGGARAGESGFRKSGGGTRPADDPWGSVPPPSGPSDDEDIPF